MVDEEENEGPPFKKSIEMSGGNQRQPRESRGDNGQLLEGAGFAFQVFVEAVETVDCDGNRRHPRPEQPRPAEIHPEKWVEQQVHRPSRRRDRD